MRGRPGWRPSPTQKEEEVQGRAKSKRAFPQVQQEHAKRSLAKLRTMIWHGCPVPWGTTIPNSVILFLLN